jgi:hypothetical protein
MTAGEQVTEFRSESLAAGTYFIRLEANGLSLVKKMHLIK